MRFVLERAIALVYFVSIPANKANKNHLNWQSHDPFEAQLLLLERIRSIMYALLFLKVKKEFVSHIHFAQLTGSSDTGTDITNRTSSDFSNRRSIRKHTVHFFGQS